MDDRAFECRSYPAPRGMIEAARARALGRDAVGIEETQFEFLEDFEGSIQT
jgi:hypothetical protein